MLIDKRTTVSLAYARLLLTTVNKKTMSGLIAITPTGELRNKLTDVNIHVLSAIKLIQELEKEHES